MITRNTNHWVRKTAENTPDLVAIISEANAFCRHCKPASPLHCIEQCEIWKTKNEFLEINQIIRRDGHMRYLLNAVKNSRRKKVMDALSEHPYEIKGLQEFLKNSGYHHSQCTIKNDYIEPLIETGLVKRCGTKYRLTLYGTKLHQILKKYNNKNQLPLHSRCYEEIVLKKLRGEQKSYVQLSKLLTQKSLSRTLKRLIEKELVKRKATSEYIFYFRTKKIPKKPFSPTERRVYENIRVNGTSVRQLSNKVGITIRSTYKYLQKLRRRRLVFTRKKPRNYMLTPEGAKLADFLEETRKLILDASKTSEYVMRHCKQPMVPSCHNQNNFSQIYFLRKSRR